MRPDFRLVQRVSRGAWSTFNHHGSGSRVDLLLSLRFSVVRSISAAVFFLSSSVRKLARQVIQAVADCGERLLLVMLSSGEVKGAMRLFGELLNNRLAPWFVDPIGRWAEFVEKRRRNKQKQWLQNLSQRLLD